MTIKALIRRVLPDARKVDSGHRRAYIPGQPCPAPLSENGCWHRDMASGASQWKWVEFGGAK